jgi:hypothetical protein
MRTPLAPEGADLSARTDATAAPTGGRVRS